MMSLRLCRRVLNHPRLVSSSLEFSSFFGTKRHESTSVAQSASRRRRRRKRNRWDDGGDAVQPASTIGLPTPFESAEATSDQYLKKASLSPWVPAPDAVARKMLELAKSTPEDIHVDLGSGDGRLNFHAMDPPFSVHQSIGIDVDENLVAMARERLAKRHPAPNVEFVVADLVHADIYDDERLLKATVVTMYFVTDALKRIQPHITRTFKSRDVRIVTCGYAMPDWEPQWVEVVLGLPLFLYELRANEEIRLAAKHDDDKHTEAGDLSPLTQDEDDDVERIESPLYDPEDKVDWDKVDLYQSSGDPDDPPPIWWRNPKK